MMCSPLLQAKNPDLGLQTHGTMNKEQLEALNNTKEQLRRENETYLRDHPELKKILAHYMARVLEERPRDVQEWTETFFLDYELKQKVERISS